MKTKLSFALILTVIVAGTLFAATLPSYEDRGTEKLTCVATNGATLGLNAKEIVLNAYGSANGTTNTVTITGTYYINDFILIRVPSDCTNKVLIADSTTVMDLDSDVVLAAGDTLLVKPVSSTKCVKVAASTQAPTATATLTFQTAKGYIDDVAVTNMAGTHILFVTNATATITVIAP